MSSSFIIMKLPPGIRSSADIPKQYSPPPLCTRAEFIDTLKQAFPDLDISNPLRLHILSTSDMITLSDEDPVIDFSVRNPSDEILDFVRAQGDWTIMSLMNGEVLP